MTDVLTPVLTDIWDAEQGLLLGRRGGRLVGWALGASVAEFLDEVFA